MPSSLRIDRRDRTMDDLSRFCCLNSECPDHGKRGAGNLTVISRHGPGKARRMLRCRTCKGRFSERKGTPLFKDVHDELVAISPFTTEVQFDEKWAFVAKKEANCDRSDPADDHKGDSWDHVALDPEHRLVVAVVPGARTIENTESRVEDFHRRTQGRVMNLMTSDDYPAYETAILPTYGETITPPRTGKPGRPKAPYRAAPPGLTYATVTKRPEEGRVVEVGTRVVFTVALALGLSRVSRAINTAFVRRQNATDRPRDARKARKTYRFSKDWRYHEAVTFLSLYSDNFSWPVRTLSIKDDQGRRRQRSPAMAAGLTDHLWSMSEWLTFPAVQHR